MLRVRRHRRAPAAARFELPPIEALTAAAQILAPTRHDAPKPAMWHPQAWAYRDTTGELQHAERWLSNGLGRARLIAARQEAPGAEPEALDDNHPASQYIAQLAGGVGGQAALLRGFGPYMLTPGVGYLCGFSPRETGGAASWQVRDSTEVRLSTAYKDGQGRYVYEVQTGDESIDWVPLIGGLVCKVHRPDPQRRWRPDSPVRGALKILHELELLTDSIAATAKSRLAGAGLLPLPAEIDFESGWKTFVQDLIKVFTTPIKDRASAAATVPFPIKVPGQWVDKIKPVQFHTLFDEHALELLALTIQRLGTAMDMPVRALTGEQENHWGKAATSDEGVQLHLVPNLELVCDGITTGYLTPALMGEVARTDRSLDVPADLADMAGMGLAAKGSTIVDGDGQRIICWYDLSQFTTKPDRSEDAEKAYDRIEIPGEGYRQETGLSDLGAPDDAEFNKRVWLKVLEHPADATLARKALTELGVVDEADLPPAPAPIQALPPGAPAEPGPGDPSPPAEPRQVDPAGEPTPRTKPDAPAPSKAADAGLLAVVAVADQMVQRALERSGNRLRQATASARKLNPDLDQAPHLMHCVVMAYQHRSLDVLLDGAFDRVPEVAGRLGQDPEVMGQALTAYTKGLLNSGKPHSWELLEAYLTATMTPAERVLQLTAGMA